MSGSAHRQMVQKGYGKAEVLSDPCCPFKKVAQAAER